MKTCPNCGATVQGGNAKCPECGFAFMNVDAVSSIVELDRRLRLVPPPNDDDESSEEQTATIIRNFPVPNTREDLLEFMSAMEPKAFASVGGGGYGDALIKKAYRAKFDECLNKARISFPDDPALKVFENNAEGRKKKKMMIWGIAAAIVILIGIISGFYIAKTNEAKTKLEQEKIEWEQQTLVEIEKYANELQERLDEIPTPTKANWQECLNKWNRVTWESKWDKYPNKFEPLFNPRKKTYGGWFNCPLEDSYKDAFLRKKNAIGDQIATAEKAATGKHAYHYDSGN